VRATTNPREHQPVQVAVVGAGLMGWWHADAIARVGGVVSAVVDPDSPRAGALASRYPGCRYTADLRDLVRDGSRAVEVVHICTPPGTHESLVAGALQAGMHVLVEKPLAQTVAATDDLLRLASSCKRLLCPVHQLLFQRGVVRAHAALQTSGPLLHVDTVACSAGAEGWADDERDRLAGEILPHPLSLLARILPHLFTDVAWQVQHPLAGEIRATGRAGAVSISVLVSTRGRPTLHTLRLIGQRSTVYVDLFHGFHVVDRGPVLRAHKIAHPFLFSAGLFGAATANLVWRTMRGEVAYPGLRELVRSFYGAVRNGGEPPITAAETLAVAVARERVLQLL
jgi:predicted dehydrogenase